MASKKTFTQRARTLFLTEDAIKALRAMADNQSIREQRSVSMSEIATKAILAMESNNK